jgi:2-dehydropantoate 2-reductase
MGAGAIGGWLGVRLAAAGEDVSLVARGAHLEAIRAHGLTLESPHGDATITPANVTDDPATIGPVDLVAFTVKLYDAEAAAAAIRPLVEARSVVLTFLNGVDGVDILSRAVGREHLLGGTIQLAAQIVGPGLIRQMGPMQDANIGELDGSRSERLAAIEKALVATGLGVRASEQIDVDIWEKFVVMAGWGAVSALARAKIGTVRRHPELAALVRRSIGEITAVARAASIPIGGDCEERSLRMIMEIAPPTAQASLLNDLEAGRRLELPWLSGTVVKMGRQLGVPTPVHEIALAALTPLIEGPPSSTEAN